MRLLKLKPELITLDAEHRLYNLNIPIVAVTGGIASGKSTVSKKLEHLMGKVVSADELVKRVYQTPEAHGFLQSQFPNCLQNNKIDFKLLRQEFFNNPKLKQEIENFIYPKLKDLFLNEIPSNATFVIYDVPLLFERNMESLVDVNILVYCPKIVQIQRLIARDKIPLELAQKILNEQMDIEIKKQKSQFILDNSSSSEQLDINFQRLIPNIWVCT